MDRLLRDIYGENGLISGALMGYLASEDALLVLILCDLVLAFWNLEKWWEAVGEWGKVIRVVSSRHIA